MPETMVNANPFLLKPAPDDLEFLPEAMPLQMTDAKTSPTPKLRRTGLPVGANI